MDVLKQNCIHLIILTNSIGSVLQYWWYLVNWPSLFLSVLRIKLLTEGVFNVTLCKMNKF